MAPPSKGGAAGVEYRILNIYLLADSAGRCSWGISVVPQSTAGFFEWSWRLWLASHSISTMSCVT